MGDLSVFTSMKSSNVQIVTQDTVKSKQESCVHVCYFV